MMVFHLLHVDIHLAISAVPKYDMTSRVSSSGSIKMGEGYQEVYTS